ncbi:MAG: hypothetical protein H6729_12315 [Deltaproteobacteria bacterium]|nr:hypothetical protein [Deltaproteobacteria bacterium]
MTLTGLPLVPTGYWQTARAVVLYAIRIVGVGALGLGCVMAWRTTWRTRWPYRLRLTLIGWAAFLAVSFWFFVSFELVSTPGPTYGWGLGGEFLERVVVEPKTGRQLFIYHESAIPDGLLSSRVAVREGVLPIEKTIRISADGFKGSAVTKRGVQLTFEGGGEICYEYTGWTLRMGCRKADP